MVVFMAVSFRSNPMSAPIVPPRAHKTLNAHMQFAEFDRCVGEHGHGPTVLAFLRA